MLPLRIPAREQLLYPSEETVGRTCCHTAMWTGTVQAQFRLYSGYFKRTIRKLRRIYKMKFYDVLTFCISSPKEQLHFKAPYVKCVLNFITLLHTLAKDVSKSTWMCVWPRRFFIVPASTLQPAVCAVIHLNAIILKKWTIKKGNLKKTVSRKVNKNGSYLHG